MSRYAILLEKFQEGGETAAEAQELALLVREDPERATALYDALMLEADLYDSYAGIAHIRSARPGRGSWASPKLVLIWSAAVFLFVGVAVLLILGRPSPRQIVPAAPPSSPSRPSEPAAPEIRQPDPPPSKPAPEKEPEEHRSKKAEIEREYQKGLREVERKRAEGKSGEADKKLREIERERDKQLRELDRRR